MEESDGKVLLSGFDLDESEMVIANNVIKNYEHKISERTSYDYLRLRLRKSRKAKTFLHQVEGELKIKNKRFGAKEDGYNLFSVLAEVLEKLLNELTHTLRTARQ
ncbi:MAG: hypothetical protein KKB21_00365 [Nanoarchaeota archaeon]|nr:hypothetical protein [Nanoarchaeota archaeon]MBU4086009.1 hypothetical protein [Nanoarchaeota archaeon]